MWAAVFLPLSFKIFAVGNFIIIYVCRPQPFWPQESVSWKMVSPWVGMFRMIQVCYIYCAFYFCYNHIVIRNEIIKQLTITQNHESPVLIFLQLGGPVWELLWESNAITGLPGDGGQVIRQAMGSGCKNRWSFTGSPTAHLLLCIPVFNRPQTTTYPWPRDWGLLIYVTYRVYVYRMFLRRDWENENRMSFSTPDMAKEPFSLSAREWENPEICLKLKLVLHFNIWWH